MRIALSSNFREKKGLAVDGQILTKLLEGMGHEVLAWQFDDNAAGDRWGKENWGDKIDLLIFLEVVNPCFFRWARRSWIFVNPEWWPPFNNHYLRDKVELVLCKTRDAVRLFKPLAKQVYYTGFTAEDFYDPSVPRKKAFLHNPGQSEWKNTLAVLACWHQFQLGIELTVVGNRYLYPYPFIKYIPTASKSELIRLKNEHRFHIMASAYEGFGQSLWESLSCGCVMITGAFPPTDELTGTPDILRVPSNSKRIAGVATAHGVSQTSIMKSVENCLRLPDSECDAIGVKARQSFLDMRTGFERRFTQLIEHVEEIGNRTPLEVKNIVDTST